MAEQIGFSGFTARIQKEALNWAVILPEFPRLMHQILTENRNHTLEKKMEALLIEEKQKNRTLTLIAVLLTVLIAWQVFQ